MSIDQAIMQVESGGDVNAIGDRGIADHAYGPMQIRRPVCVDVNRAFGTSFEAQDMLGWTSRSLAVFWLYMTLYATSERLGRPVTDQDRARIWNGGPMGYQSDATLGYWNLIKKYL